MRWLVFVLLIMCAATCGQKGPLVLPDTYSLLKKDSNESFFTHVPSMTRH